MGRLRAVPQDHVDRDEQAGRTPLCFGGTIRRSWSCRPGSRVLSGVTVGEFLDFWCLDFITFGKGKYHVWDTHHVMCSGAGGEEGCCKFGERGGSCGWQGLQLPGLCPTPALTTERAKITSLLGALAKQIQQKQSSLRGRLLRGCQLRDTGQVLTRTQLHRTCKRKQSVRVLRPL